MSAPDDLCDAAVAEPDDLADGPEAHAGLVGGSDGAVAPGAGLGVAPDGVLEGGDVVHDVSIQNLTDDPDSYRKVDMIDTVIQAANNLDRNEALFLPSEYVIARSSTGRLRFGHSTTTHWYRGDGLELLRDHLAAMLAPSQGHYASRYARELEIPSVLRPVKVENVGKRTFQVVYDPSDLAWDAFHTLDCDHVDWKGRPYGGMDCLCSDGRHMRITGAGEIHDLTAQAA